MNVLHLTRDYPPMANGGISRAVGGLVQNLDNHHVKSFVISFDAWKPKTQRRTNKKTAPRYGIDAHATQVFRLKDKSGIKGMEEFGEASGSRIVHVHDALLWEHASRLSKKLGARIIYTLHVYHKAINRIRGIQSTASSKAEMLAIEQASSISLPTVQMLKLLATDFPSTEKKLRLASWGVERVTDCTPSDKTVAYAARFSDIKGTGVLRKLIPRVLSKVPEARFLLAGGVPFNPRAEKKWIDSFSNDLDESMLSRLEIAGWLDEQSLHRRLAKTWVMISPSKFETFGLSVLQAMAHSVPVVASRTPGVESILPHGIGGYLADGTDVDIMTEYLLKILASEKLRDVLGKNAAQEARRKWLWKSRIVDWIKLYEELL